MPEVITPSWADLHAVVSEAQENLMLVTPFYTESGISQLLDHLGSNVFVAVTTRLSPPDWAAGVADPEAMDALLDLLPGRHSLGILQRLHAKAYVADRDHALIGSSNLTEGGFNRNVELMVRFQGLEAADARAAVEAACVGARPLDLLALRDWIAASRSDIEDAKRAAGEAAEELAPAQARLDRLLGFGQSVRRLPNPNAAELADFIAWTRRHAVLAGAEMILRRHDDRDGHHLQGHVKQGFSAVLRFLTEYPELRTSLVLSLATLRPDQIYQLDAAVGDAWVRHVDDHATDESGDGAWSYAVLRGQMPASLGGTLQNGGGNISTVKRMLPLVAQYLVDRGSAG